MKTILTSILIVCVTFIVIDPLSAAEPGKGTVARTIKVGELSRTYYLHVPSGLPRDKAVALVLVFHGGGGTPEYTERETRFSELADREGFLVAYPEGISRSWNDGRNERSIAVQRDEIDDIGFVAALIDDVAMDYRLDAKRVFAAGISNGAIFSHYLAVSLSSRIAAIAPVVGGLAKPVHDTFNPEKPVAVLILQGTEDPLVPYYGGYITLPWGTRRGAVVSTHEAVRTWVEHNGCQREAVRDDVPDKDPRDGCRVKIFAYPEGRDGTAVVLYRLEGGGHTWPNGSQYLPPRVIGRVCRDIDGTEVIWKFFKQHPRP